MKHHIFKVTEFWNGALNVKKVQCHGFFILLFRVGHHSTSDDSSAYRSKEEVQEYETKNDPLLRYKTYLLERNLWSEVQENEHQKESKQQVKKYFVDFKTTSWIRFNLKFISKQKISNFSYTCAFTLQMIHIIYEYILCMGFINVLNLRVSQYKLCMIHLIYAMYGVELSQES